MANLKVKIFFDGGCPVCSREIKFYRRNPAASRCEWVDLRTVPDASLPAGYSREVLLNRFHIEHPKAGIVSGALAFAYLWQEMFRWNWIVRFVSFPVVQEACEFGYKGFLILRRIFIQRAHRDLDTGKV